MSSQDANKGTLVTRNTSQTSQEKKKAEQEPVQAPKTENKTEILCEICKQPISAKVAEFSKAKMGRCLCMTCQKKPQAPEEQLTLEPVVNNGELPF